MLFRLLLFGFVWVLAAVVVEMVVGGGGSGMLVAGVMLGLLWAIVMSFLKGRPVAGGVPLLGIALGLLMGEVGDAGIVLAPLFVLLLLLPVFGATFSAKPGSWWAGRFPPEDEGDV